MDYVPRYSQPFTLQEARQLAVPIIAEEISRLQNSLAYLQRTQDQLKDALSTAPGDADLTEAFEENEIVIGSQSERISMLRIVLAEKGVPMSAHYDVGSQPASGDPSSQTPRNFSQPTAALHMDEPAPATRDGEEGGVYL
ncbi:hypothetical protein LXA43DRAFT_882491 [Ganoderma leucocontextum]|nr:hypothetical protein LXA43DRAFT_882491 [Ganoderma leucocontextum]